jgi:hypothetical protein
VLQPGDEFLVLACDGIWDVLTNQEVGGGRLAALSSHQHCWVGLVFLASSPVSFARLL